MKKAIDQTIRDLKREVNKKVLKVPGIEQKVLDATSNEPWGPHGAHLSYIAQASRNYHEYQMIMAVLWKRINDTGKNWRHVYKALIVLEYLVAHGSERVIDEIKEHAYQISTLTGFQYIDSNGRDQGNNVRKKSHSLVVLVNDKERVMEVRQKASANKEKFHSASMYRAGSYSSTGGYGDRYEDERYAYRDYDRNGNGREWGKDDGRYGRNTDSYSRDGDRYGRDSDDRYSRYGDEYDDYRGRSRGVDQYPRGSRSRSSDGYRDRTYDDDGRYSARSSGARAEDRSQDEGLHEQKLSEQDIPPPPYEEAVRDSQNPVHDEGNEETAESPAPKTSSPTGSTEAPAADAADTAAPPGNKEVDGFDMFDPRGSDTAPPTTTNNGEMDLLGSLMDSFTSDALALMPTTSATTTSEGDVPISSGQTEASPSGSTAPNQPFEDPFGDSPFKATQATDGIPNEIHAAASPSNIQPSATGQASEPPHQASPNMEANSSMDFGDTFPGLTYDPSNVSTAQLPSTDSQLALPDPSLSDQNVDILADILPPTTGSTAPQDSQAAFSAPSGSFVQQQSTTQGTFFQQGGYASPTGSQGSYYSPPVQHGQQNTNAFGNMPPQSPPLASSPVASVASNESPPAITTLSATTQPSPKKFEPKSAVWADTLSKGLVDFNISGPKANPMADIGVDFDTINRREKRERPSPTTNVTSTITMGKAMGAGSGMGRAGASSLTPPNPNMGGGQRMGMGMGMGGNPGMGMGMGSNPGMGMGMGMGMRGNPGMGMGGNPGMGMAGNPGMGMGMAGNPGLGMNMGGYGGMNQQIGMGGTGMNMGMGMNMNQGAPMRPPGGSQPGPNMPGNYNPAMGQGGYPQQPYGGYR